MSLDVEAVGEAVEAAAVHTAVDRIVDHMPVVGRIVVDEIVDRSQVAVGEQLLLLRQLVDSERPEPSRPLLEWIARSHNLARGKC